MTARQRVVVIDYGMGNLHSVAKAVEHAGKVDVTVTDDPDAIRRADRVVFPGQGAARDCMRAIHAHHLAEPVTEAAASKPFLGICMGLQVLYGRSEEHPDTPCLALEPGEVHRLPGVADGARLAIPQIGWNRVTQTRDHPLWSGIDDGERFYFCNSYYVRPDDEATITGTTRYGVEFASAVGHDNVFAVQFHPEKSARAGLRLLGNFLEWSPG